MSSPRFFIDRALAVGEEFELPSTVAHHAARVLRLRTGASIVLFNGRGGEFEARLGGDARALRASVLQHVAIERESPLAITLVQSWIAADKLDWTIEKAVELGVRRILLTPMQRAVTRLDGARRDRRIERLRDIALSACAQCGRNRVPDVAAHATLEVALQEARADGARGLVMDAQAEATLLGLARGSDQLALVVGPEGGLDPGEVTLVTRLGYRVGRLGPRTLRTETAGLAALAALQSSAGDFAAAHDEARRR